jgi:uncharacterized protein YggT (Ycf19 family)
MLYVVSATVHLMLSAVMLAMTARAIMSLIPNAQDTKFFAFVYMISEPITVPIRFLFYQLNLFQNTPLDISFLVTYLLLWMIDGALL